MRTPRIIGGGLSKVERERKEAAEAADAAAGLAAKKAQEVYDRSRIAPQRAATIEGRIENPYLYNRQALRASIDREYEFCQLWVAEVNSLVPARVTRGIQCNIGMFPDTEILRAIKPNMCAGMGWIDYFGDESTADIPDDMMWRYTVRVGSRQVDVFADCRMSEPPKFDWGLIDRTKPFTTEVPTPRNRMRFDTGEWANPIRNGIYVGFPYA